MFTPLRPQQTMKTQYILGLLLAITGTYTADPNLVGHRYGNEHCDGKGDAIDVGKDVKIPLPGGVKSVKMLENAIIYGGPGCGGGAKQATGGCDANGGNVITCVEIGGDA